MLWCAIDNNCKMNFLDNLLHVLTLADNLRVCSIADGVYHDFNFVPGNRGERLLLRLPELKKLVKHGPLIFPSEQVAMQLVRLYCPSVTTPVVTASTYWFVWDGIDEAEVVTRPWGHIEMTLMPLILHHLDKMWLCFSDTIKLEYCREV